MLTTSLRVRVTTDGPSLHKINPLFMGCHSDSGFTHQGAPQPCPVCLPILFMHRG